MELNRLSWSSANKENFFTYLKTLGNPEKETWARKILNTKLPLMVISTPKMKALAKEMAQGNWFEFLNQHWYDCYESMAIYGMLVTKIEDFNLFTKYLEHYLMQADNWALCDLLAFNITPSNALSYVQLAKRYLSSPYVFVRRTGVIIFLHMVIKQKQFLPQVFEMLDMLQNEQEYYVNMAAAWLLCECFVQHKEETLAYLAQHKTNKFVVNKGIQKCRDSYRVTPADKEMLLQFKVK